MLSLSLSRTRLCGKLKKGDKQTRAGRRESLYCPSAVAVVVVDVRGQKRNSICQADIKGKHCLDRGYKG